MGIFLQKRIIWTVFLIFVIAFSIFFTVFIFITKNKSQSTPIESPGSCLILEEKFCSQARERKPVMINGVEYTYIVFTNSSEEKVPVFVPEDGTFLNKATDSGAPFSGVRATVRLPTGVYDIRGAVTVPDMIQVKDPKQGMVIGYVLPDKTIYISKTKGTPEGPRTDEEQLKRLFRLQ